MNNQSEIALDTLCMGVYDRGVSERLESPSICDIFLSFLRLGATAFGGPAMVVYIGELVVNRKKWLDRETFEGGVALAQSVPGATAMQTAAYAGLRARGVRGALASYLGFGLPAFCLMLVLSALYGVSRGLPQAASLFSGLQVVVVAIVANATYTFGRSSLKGVAHIIVAAASAAALWLRVSPFYVILGAALAGILLVRRAGQARPATARAVDVSAAALIACPASAVLGLIACALFLPRLFDLALLMLKVDVFAFGGGFASLPLMLQQVVSVKGWMDATTFMDGIALGQVTPGPIVITSAFVGYVTHGVAGAAVAAAAIFTPSFLMVVLCAPFFDKLGGSPVFARATRGVLASFVGLLLFVTTTFAAAVPWNAVRAAMAVAALIALVRKVDVLYIVLPAAALSFVLF
jgi:chromate transporter